MMKTKVLSAFQFTNKTNLTIIADGEIEYLPLELTIKKKPEKMELDYRGLAYLFRDFNINYAHSVALLFKDTNSDSVRHVHNYVGFAPVYGDDIDNLLFAKADRFRSAMVPLEWNQKEADAVSVYLNGKAYLAEKATEGLFKNIAHNSRILHLAMHAFVDDEDPMYSKLVFTQDNDSIEDGFLHTFELYNMELNAELAVLSACETGYGKLVKGEGIMSLARGFSYAGVPSVVMSHWQVDDRSTSELMQLFYRNLSDGMTKDEALRQAKLEFLETTDVLRTHPYFWGSFVLLGDPSEIELGSNQQTRNLLFAGIAAFLLFFVVYMRRRRGKS